MTKKTTYHRDHVTKLKLKNYKVKLWQVYNSLTLLRNRMPQKSERGVDLITRFLFMYAIPGIIIEN
jgi:hypothetical protein